MEDSPCSRLVKTLTTQYTVTDLDAFLSSSLPNSPSFFNIQVSTQDTQTYLASIIGSIEHETREIFVGDVRRDTNSDMSKGLGQVLLYLVVCKALELGYTVAFSATGPELYRYYNSLGFERNVESPHTYITLPTRNIFHPRIRKTVNGMKRPSAHGGTRTQRRKIRTSLRVSRRFSRQWAGC